MGVIATGARHVTDEMFFAAAKTLAREVAAEDLAQGRIYPPLARIREVSAAIAAAVAETAYGQGTGHPAQTRGRQGHHPGHDV